MAGRMCMAGGAWWGVHGRGNAWQAVCVVGGGRGMYGRGVCMAGKTATAAESMHPTGMHSCLASAFSFSVVYCH